MSSILANCRTAFDGTLQVAFKSTFFFAIGNVCGQLLNYTVQQIKPSFFKSNFVNPWTAGLCSAIFVIVDFFAQTLFEKLFGSEAANRPIMVMARVVICVPVTIFFCTLEGSVIAPVPALATIICSIAGFVLLKEIAKRYQSPL
jgi:hypothetical protein